MRMATETRLGAGSVFIFLFFILLSFGSFRRSFVCVLLVAGAGGLFRSTT